MVSPANPVKATLKIVLTANGQVIAEYQDDSEWYGLLSRMREKTPAAAKPQAPAPKGPVASAQPAKAKVSPPKGKPQAKKSPKPQPKKQPAKAPPKPKAATPTSHSAEVTQGITQPSFTEVPGRIPENAGERLTEAEHAAVPAY